MSKYDEAAVFWNSIFQKGEFHFHCGGIDELNIIPDESIDAVVLFNIVDNLFPDDAKRLISFNNIYNTAKSMFCNSFEL